LLCYQGHCGPCREGLHPAVDATPVKDIASGVFPSGLGMTVPLDALKRRHSARGGRGKATRQEGLGILLLGFPR